MGTGKNVVVFRSEATSRIVCRNRSWTAIGVLARTRAACASFSAAFDLLHPLSNPRRAIVTAPDRVS
jgi:hypothetical protein